MPNECGDDNKMSAICAAASYEYNKVNVACKVNRRGGIKAEIKTAYLLTANMTVANTYSSEIRAQCQKKNNEKTIHSHVIYPTGLN